MKKLIYIFFSAIIACSSFLLAMDDKIRITSEAMSFFPENSLFFVVLQGDIEQVKLKLEDSNVRENINVEIRGGALNGYTSLRLAIDLWRGKFIGRLVSASKKQLYREIAQILVNKGAKVDKSIKDDLESMGISLPMRRSQRLPKGEHRQSIVAVREGEFEDFPLIKAVLNGDLDVVRSVILYWGQANSINREIGSGKYAGYRGLQLAIRLWHEKNDAFEKQNYREIIQFLIDNGAIFTRDMENDLRIIGVSLPGRGDVHFSGFRDARRMDEGYQEDLSRFVEEEEDK